MALDPVVENMLKQMAAADAPAMVDSTPDEARAMYRAMQSSLPAPHVMSIENSLAGDVPVRIYRSAMETRPCILYFHGGGWVIGDLETHDGVCRQLCLATDMTVIAVDYRLAPEHPFPAPLDDCYDALRWVHENAARLDIDASRIAVAGDSAGGNLAAAICLMARDNNGPQIAYQLLIYPVTSTGLDTPSYAENAEGYLLTRDGMAWFWGHYIGENESHRTDPLAAPLLAADLAGLPSACVITAEFDPLRDEGDAYAARLEDAGIQTAHRQFEGMIHGFFGMTDLLEGSRQAMDLAADQLKAALMPGR